jgi:hypothetical protein
MGVMLKKPDDVAGSAAPAIIIGMFVAFGGVLFGYVPSCHVCFLTEWTSAMTLALLVAS